MSGYLAYNLVDQKKRIKQANDLLENGHIYEAMLAALSPQVLVGVFAAIQLFIIIIDAYGFLLAASYVPLTNWQRFLFMAVISCYIIESLNGFFHLKKIRRIFAEKTEPIKLMARYARFLAVADSPAAYISSYGKCLIAVNLFLRV